MASLDPSDLHYETHPNVYDPADDTFLLAGALQVKAGQRVIEVGCGAGIASIHAARQGARVVATDINPDALRLCRRNATANRVRLDLARTDLLRGLRVGRSDLVVFNPPYLPTAPGDRVPGPLNRAFDGGPDGLRVTLRFLEELRALRTAKALLVVSSLQDDMPLASWEASGGVARSRAVKRLGLETLTVYELGPAPPVDGRRTRLHASHGREA